jgi:hypothetical protein
LQNGTIVPTKVATLTFTTQKIGRICCQGRASFTGRTRCAVFPATKTVFSRIAAFWVLLLRILSWSTKEKCNKQGTKCTEQNINLVPKETGNDVDRTVVMYMSALCCCSV